MNKNVTVTLTGCFKNDADAETIEGILIENEFNITEDYNLSLIDIVFTCCFITDAIKENIEIINNILEYKKNFPAKKIIVVGCMSQYYGESINDYFNGDIDYIVGVSNYDLIIKICRDIIEKKKSTFKTYVTKPEKYIEKISYSKRINNRKSYSYVKISDGCDICCSFCSIPNFKGKHISRNNDNIIEEIGVCLENGSKEIILVSQDTPGYYDKKNKVSLIKLLEKVLSAYNDIECRIRLLYLNPLTITEDLLYFIQDEKKICNYFDIPFQHFSDSVLKNMYRYKPKTGFPKLLNLLKNNFNNMFIRSTFIVGFPGETQDDFNILKNTIQQFRFHFAGFFKYDQQPETAAAKLPNQISDKTKNERYNILTELQQKITFDKFMEYIDTIQRVIIDEKDEYGYIGRTEFQNPDIDPIVYINDTNTLKIGNFYDIKITDTNNDYFYGELI